MTTEDRYAEPAEASQAYPQQDGAGTAADASPNAGDDAEAANEATDTNDEQPEPGWGADARDPEDSGAEL
jgi:hypothetical protein